MYIYFFSLLIRMLFFWLKEVPLLFLVRSISLVQLSKFGVPHLGHELRKKLWIHEIPSDYGSQHWDGDFGKTTSLLLRPILMWTFHCSL